MLNFKAETAQPDDVLAILAEAGLSGCGEDLKDAMLSFQKGLNISVVLYKKRTLWPGWSYDRCQLDDEVRVPWESDASTVTLWHDDDALTRKREVKRSPYPPSWIYFRFAEMALRLAHERSGMVAPKSIPFVDSDGHKHNTLKAPDKKQLDSLRRRLITHFKKQIVKLEKAAARAEKRAAKYTSPKSRIAKKMAQEIVRAAQQRAAMQQEIFALTNLEGEARACDRDTKIEGCGEVRGKLHRAAEKVPAAVMVPVKRARPITKPQQDELAMRDWLLMLQREIPGIPVIGEREWKPNPKMVELLATWHPDGERQAQARRRAWLTTVWSLIAPAIDSAISGEAMAQKVARWAVGTGDWEKILRDGERYDNASNWDALEKLLRFKDPRLEDDKTYSQDRAALERRNAMRNKNPCCNPKTASAAIVAGRVSRLVGLKSSSASGARGRAQ